MEQQGNYTARGKPKDSEKICLSATLSTTSPTWTDRDVNPGLRDEKLATNRLSYDTTYTWLVERVYVLRMRAGTEPKEERC
jgi:hypothetical protein